MLEQFMDPGFWIDLGQIILVNLILSGDNAVVIALAARSLPEQKRRQAIVWGSVAAILMRVVLTIVAAELLTLPYLKLVGSVLLFWIALQLLEPESEDDADFKAHDNLTAAIRTILIADLVMSLDNVLAVAAAAHGSLILLGAGLAISIPLVIFGSALVLKLMDRFSWFVWVGSALLGYVAGEMLTSDPILASRPELAENTLVHQAIPWFTAALVLLIGRFVARRKPPAAEEKPVDLVSMDDRGGTGGRK